MKLVVEIETPEMDDTKAREDVSQTLISVAARVLSGDVQGPAKDLDGVTRGSFFLDVEAGVLG